ncbi:hypothetical protein [Bartonella sp. B17]
MENLTINSGANARVYAGSILEGVVTANNFGRLTLYVNESNKPNTKV